MDWSISPKQLSGIIWTAPGDLVYDRTAKTPTFAADGVIGTDTVEVYASLTEEKDNVNVGTFTFTATGLDNDNYTLPASVVSPDYTITPKEITLAWTQTGLVYNGEVQAPVASAVGVVSGDTCNVTVTGGQKDAGSYIATAASVDNGNYMLPQSVTQQFTIAQKAVTVTADDMSKNYGEQDPVLTATVSGTIGTDEVTYTIARESGDLPGRYAITVSGDASQGNYAVSFVPGTFTIIGLFTVTFDACGGSCDTGSMETGTDGKLASLPDAVRDDYTFDGWYTQAEGGEKIFTSYVFTGDATVYAHWTETPVAYTVTFDANGGSCDTPSMKTDTDGKLT